MSSKKKEDNKEVAKVTYNEALDALRAINPVKNVQGQRITIKSDLSSIKGKVGMHVYHVKHDIKDACKPFEDKQEELIKELNKVIERSNVLEKPEDEKEPKKAPVKKEKETPKKEESKDAKSAPKKEEDPLDGLSLEELKEKKESILGDLEELGEMEVDIVFKKGRLKLSEIQEALDADEYELLKFAIEDDTE